MQYTTTVGSHTITAVSLLNRSMPWATFYSVRRMNHFWFSGTGLSWRASRVTYGITCVRINKSASVDVPYGVFVCRGHINSPDFRRKNAFGCLDPGTFYFGRQQYQKKAQRYSRVGPTVWSFDDPRSRRRPLASNHISTCILDKVLETSGCFYG